MKIDKIGVQLWTIREHLGTEEQITESFKKLKDLGYDTVQTAGCAVPFEIFGACAQKAGLEIVGTHDDMELMYNDFDTALKNHQALNTKLMGIGGSFLTETADVKEIIRKANAIGENAIKHGMKFTYHHHSHEFTRNADNLRPIDLLIDGLNPETTSFVADTYWLQHAGADVCQWLEKLSGRIDILHLKDMAVTADNKPFFTEIGNGNLNWDGIMAAAEKAGVKYYVVEEDFCPGEPFESLKMSSDFLHKNFM